MKKRNTLITAIVVASAISGGSWIAAANANTDKAEQAAQATIAQDQAVNIALQAVPGTVIESEFESEDGVTLWEIEILDANQQVTEVEVDANTGEILSQKVDTDENDEEDEGDTGPEDETNESKGVLEQAGCNYDS